MGLLDSIIAEAAAHHAPVVKPAPKPAAISFPAPAPMTMRTFSTLRWVIRVDGQPIEQGFRDRGWRERVRSLRSLHTACGSSVHVHIDRYRSRYRAAAKSTEGRKAC
jgi:hypothetical protein